MGRTEKWGRILTSLETEFRWNQKSPCLCLDFLTWAMVELWGMLVKQISQENHTAHWLTPYWLIPRHRILSVSDLWLRISSPKVNQMTRKLPFRWMPVGQSLGLSRLKSLFYLSTGPAFYVTVQWEHFWVLESGYLDSMWLPNTQIYYLICLIQETYHSGLQMPRGLIFCWTLCWFNFKTVLTFT